MNLKIEQNASRAIVYDADCIQHPAGDLFDPEYWQRRSAILGTAAGRGNALLLETEFGALVLRSFLRGGWVSKFSRDHYFFTGFEHSRSLKEVRILEKLTNMGLPVPKPLAGLCRRKGLSYTASILTHRITPATTLADMLETRSEGVSGWSQVGKCIRSFHDAGVIHPDLNARNILVGDDENVYLIDFDRASIRPGASRSFSNNLKRLHRSLVKLWPETRSGELESCWLQLTQAYDQAG